VKSKNNWSNGVAWHSWQARPTRGRWVPVSHELEPNQRLPLFPWANFFRSLLSTGWFQERIRVWFIWRKIACLTIKLCLVPQQGFYIIGR